MYVAIFVFLVSVQDTLLRSENEMVVVERHSVEHRCESPAVMRYALALYEIPADGSDATKGVSPVDWTPLSVFGFVKVEVMGKLAAKRSLP